MYKDKKALIISLFATLLALQAVPVFADDRNFIIETGCGNLSTPSLTGIVPLPENTYDVYVRLGKRGEQTKVSGYARVNSMTSACQRLGEIDASGDEWRLLGTMSDPDGEEQTILQLSSPLFENLADANRPSLMLVTHDNPLCRPTVECKMTLGDQTGYVRPSGTLLNQNSLHVVRVTDPQQDVVRKVRYYVDDHLAYTTPKLEAFDERYIAYEGQRLARVVEYESGQQVVFEKVVPEGFLDSFPNFLFRLVRSNPGVVRFLLWFGGIVSVLVLVRAAIQLIERRRQWKYDHGFLQHMSGAALTMGDKNRMAVQDMIRKTLRIGTGLVLFAGLAIGAVMTTDAFALQTYTVDGQSMESTFHDGKRMLVAKVPRTIANINGLEYVPKRGEVIVARMVYGITAADYDTDDTGTIVKRVLGLPGERVVVEDGVLTVYNKEHPNGFQPDMGASWEKTMHKDVAKGRLEITLGAAELFVSGDNRPESIDSRFNGPINVKQVIGPVLFQRAF